MALVVMGTVFLCGSPSALRAPPPEVEASFLMALYFNTFFQLLGEGAVSQGSSTVRFWSMLKYNFSMF